MTLGTPYCFSAQVAGTGRIFLDIWDGTDDHSGAPVALTTHYQTLQMCIPIPVREDSNPVKLEVHSRASNGTIIVYFSNAAAVEDAVAVEAAAYKNIAGASYVIPRSPSSHTPARYSKRRRLARNAYGRFDVIHCTESFSVLFGRRI